MIHSLTGLIHTLFATLALLTGVIIFLRPKRGAFHRSLGYIYSLSMIILIITAFSIYRLTRSFNILHLAAIVSAITLTLALRPALTRKPAADWLSRHYHWMSWSYIGLFAAFLAELSTRLIVPYLAREHGVRSFGAFWAIFGLVTFLICWSGATIIERNKKIIPGYTPPDRPNS